eukprot:gene12110-5602_t
MKMIEEKEVRILRSSDQSKVKDQIVKKLEDYMSVPSKMLAEYIMTLLLHSNTQNEICEKLKDFLGKDSEEFAHGIFEITYKYSKELPED